MEFSTRNYSRRYLNPFCLDIDRYWFDMVHTLLVLKRDNITINETAECSLFVKKGELGCLPEDISFYAVWNNPYYQPIIATTVAKSYTLLTSGMKLRSGP
ncbi:hypothetical protein EJ110_NYTH43739 [Nymphaea thermarum]|nr:hypothetical protein EJ110_NYTH43739 [Nymphaea thermarum]